MEDLKLTLRNFLSQDGKIKAIPSKRKLQIATLFFLAERFEKGKRYTEKEINAVLNSACEIEDAAYFRREMCSYGFFTRKPDGSEYTVCENPPLPEEFEL